jgi:hypothetical protein
MPDAQEIGWLRLENARNSSKGKQGQANASKASKGKQIQAFSSPTSRFHGLY